MNLTKVVVFLVYMIKFYKLLTFSVFHSILLRLLFRNLAASRAVNKGEFNMFSSFSYYFGGKILNRIANIWHAQSSDLTIPVLTSWTQYFQIIIYGCPLFLGLNFELKSHL